MRLYTLLSKIVVAGAFISFCSTMTIFAQANGTVNENDVNVRSTNSTDSSVVTTLNEGQAVVIKEKAGDFYKVSFEGADDVYISSQFITINKTQGTISEDGVNVRKEPYTDAQILTKAVSGDSFEVTGRQGDWYIVNYNGSNGYVRNDFISGEMLEAVGAVAAPAPVAEKEEVFAVVTSDSGLNLREESSTAANVVTVLSTGDVLDIVEVDQEWVKVSANGEYGYVSSDYISLQTGAKPENSGAREARANDIVNYAKQFLGTPYRSGGTDLNIGVDCSGFTYTVMKNKGINLNRSSRDQFLNGRVISKAELQPADLVFFDSSGANDGNISHVGLYIGDGKYIHSSTTKVIISDMSSAYSQRTYISACRVVE